MFNIEDTVLHADAIHRGGGQLIPASRKAFYAAQLMCLPRLQEPIFEVEVSCLSEAIEGVYRSVMQNRGVVDQELE